MVAVPRGCFETPLNMKHNQADSYMLIRCSEYLNKMKELMDRVNYSINRSFTLPSTEAIF